MRDIIRGDTIEEKLRSIGATLRSFQRRLSTKVIGLIPPVPFVHRQAMPDTDGTVFECIVPLHGRVIRLCMYAKRVEKGTTIRVYYVSKSVERIITLENVEQTRVQPIDELISAGDIIRVVCDPPDGLAGILIGVLIVPEVYGQTGKMEYAVDQFLQLEEDEDAGENDKNV